MCAVLVQHMLSKSFVYTSRLCVKVNRNIHIFEPTKSEREALRRPLYWDIRSVPFVCVLLRSICNCIHICSTRLYNDSVKLFEEMVRTSTLQGN